MLYHQLSEGGSVLFSKLAALAPNEKVKCLSAVGTRKSQAGGRKESQQRKALAEVKLHCPGELKACPVHLNEGSPLCSAEGSFSQGVNLFIHFWTKVREWHKDAQDTVATASFYCSKEWCRKGDPSAWACPCPREEKLKNKDAVQRYLDHLHCLFSLW